MDPMRRYPVASSVVCCVALAAALIVAAFMLPLRGNVQHAGGHIALAVPLVLLLAWALVAWPPAGPGIGARLARGTLLAGLAIAGSGLVTEAVGAFGYAGDRRSVANDLTVLHDFGVALWPVGFVSLMAGAIMSCGVALAGRGGTARSRIVTGAAVVALVVVVAFIAGGFIFGY